MIDEPTTSHLSGEEVMALKAAARRQLARWINKRELTPHQHAQRAALARAIRKLDHKAFAHGCKLHADSCEEN
jgi:hypothetical protein